MRPGDVIRLRERRMQQWEYLRVQVSVQEIKELDPKLVELGEEGWELAGVVESAGSYVHMWFKRQRR